MARTTKLNDLQLVLLASATQRSDGSLFPAPDSIADQGVRIRKALPPLIKRALVEEVDAASPTQAWRNDGDRQIGLIITDSGRLIIVAEEGEASDDRGDAADVAQDAAGAGPQVDKTPAPPPSAVSKIVMVLSLLEREQGATLDEMVAATAWLPHTTRAALTGLRKKGHALDKRKRSETTCYHIVAPA